MANSTFLMQHTKAQWIIVAMYGLAIMGLYFENLAGPAMLFFLMGMVWLGFQKTDKTPIATEARNWMWVSIAYAGVMILSFFVHLPITDDGVWRLSSYSFILFMLGFFYLHSRYVVSPLMLLSIVVISFLYALTVFLIEFYQYGAELFSSPTIRLGEYASIDTGGYANFVMVTFLAAIGVVALQKNKAFRITGLVVLGCLILFAVLTKGRTNVFFLPFIFIAIVLFALHNKLFRIKPILTKLLLVVAILAVTIGALLSKDRFTETVHDFEKMEQQDYYSSLGLRMFMYKVGIDIVQEYPIFGVGLNHFKESKVTILQQNYSATPEHVQQAVIGFTQIHNQFLMDAIFAGVFGLIALVLFLAYPAWLYFNFYRRATDLSVRWLAFSGLMFIAYTCFTGMFGTIFTYTYTTLFYMLVNMMLLGYLAQNVSVSLKIGKN